MKRYIPLILVGVFIVLFLSSCKSTFRFEEGENSSEIILYKENFKYTEKTAYSDFHVWGRYVIKDSIVQLFYDKKCQLPYSYSKSNITTLTKNYNSDEFSVKVTEASSREAIVGLVVALRTRNRDAVEYKTTDSLGMVSLTKNKQAHTLEIHSLNYMTQCLYYKHIKNNDIEIVLDKYIPGGRMSDGCLVNFLDLILEYKFDNSKDIPLMERNGVVFKKID